MKAPLLAIALLLSLFAFDCRADLEFKKKLIELKAKASDETLPAKFEFKNTGKKEVDITKIDVGCSCLKVTTDKKVYAPGESGTVDVVFKLGSFTGYQKKGLTIITGEERIRLHVAVQIPNVITIEPNVIEWEVGEKPEPKTFKIKVEHSDPIEILEITCKREGFEHELKEIKKGREYEIKLTPPSTEKSLMGLLLIKTDCEIKKHQKQLAFFAVSRPKPKTKTKSEEKK